MNLHDYFNGAGLKLPVPFASYIDMAFDPRLHQITGLNKVLTTDHYGLYDKPGTGKTLIAHAYSLYWISEGQRCLAVMPPNLVYQYHDELFEVYRGADKYVKCHILNQTPAKRKKLYEEWAADNSWPQIMCMSYQMFQREYRKLMKLYRVAVFDEAQFLKSPTAKIFKQVTEWKNQKGGTSSILMTGTPTHNELIDCYTLIKHTNPDAYRNFKHFDREHCTYTRIPLRQPRRMRNGGVLRSFLQRTGYKNQALMRKNLYKHGRRILKEDVMEIQHPTIVEVPVKLDPGHQKLYRKLVKERLLQLEDELIIATNAQALRQKCLQIVTCPELFTDEMKFKNQIVETTKSLIEGIDINETKAIVFCNYQDSVRNLAQYFEEYNPALMYGPSSAEKNRQKFLQDDTCRLLIANPKSAGAGFNFQDHCHNIIFAEPTGVPGDFQQCMDRVHRSGQKNLVNVWVLKAMGTISPKATQAMLRKEGQAQKIHFDRHSFIEDFNVAA